MHIDISKQGWQKDYLNGAKLCLHADSQEEKVFF